MLRLERDRLGEIELEVGDALAGDAIDEVEREVVKAGAAQGADGSADVVRACAPLERLEQVRLEALRAERDAVDALLAEQCCQGRRERLRICLDGRLGGGRKRGEQPRERRGLREGGRAATEEDGLDLIREQTALQLQFPEQRVDVAAVVAVVAGDGDEVAVAAAVRTEREVDVEVGGARSSPRVGDVEPPSGTVRGKSSHVGDAGVSDVCRCATITCSARPG